MSGIAANFPATANALGKIIQTTDGSYTETYNVPVAPGPYTHLLGKNLTPPLPTGWQDVPLGAFPINPPGAVTIGSPGGYNTGGGFLTAAGVYKVAMTNVTDYGETILGSVTTFTLGATFTAANYVLPSVSQGTADAPIRKRRLYRSVAGGSSLFLVAEIADLNQLSYVDGMADAFLLTAPPSVNGSGAIGTVLVSGGGHAGGYWTEVAPGTGLVGGQYIVDYSTGITGGTITHAAADANTLGVSAQFTAGTLASATVVNNIIQSIQDMAAANAGAIPTAQKAAVSGVASLDSNTHVLQALAKGIRQVVVVEQTIDNTGLTSTSLASYPNLAATITIQAGSSILGLLAMTVYNNDVATQTFVMETFNAANLKFGGISVPPAGRGCLSTPIVHSNPGAGTYTYNLEYQSSGTGGFHCRPVSQAGYEQARFILIEYA
jgi:hypothetical protein